MQHPLDEELLRAADGELSEARGAEIARHLESCWQCRARKQELEGAVADFVRFQRDRFDAQIPSGAGPRALLKAQLAQQAHRLGLRFDWRIAAAACFVVALIGAGIMTARKFPHRTHRAVAISLPEPSLTPGAVVKIDRDQVCSSNAPKNKMVPVALQHRVFEEYGIQDSEPNAYEVDYLITPALGGADDIHNLWPQAYSSATWNARVKDQLEDRLRDMVCRGELDLQAAQREIASDWIAAYRKYFQRELPMSGN